MRKKFVFLIAGLFCLMAAFRPDGNQLFSYPGFWPAPAYDFSKNPLSEEKIKLGRVLFYDPILSKNNTISCASCHSPYNAFAHTDHALSHGIDDRIGKRNAPALMNLAWQKTFMWDGAIHHLDVQSLFPITHPDEMGENIHHVIQKLNEDKAYRKLYREAFGDSTVTTEKTLKALAQFMLTLVSCESKYDKVREGKDTFTPQEKNGYALFQQHCSSCHTEPLFTNHQFENNGLEADPFLMDCGRMEISGKTEDSLKFKVPSLRNVEYSFPYMHDGRFKKLSEVLNHYSSGIKHGPSLSEQLKQPVVLSSNEKVDLISFLLTLSDKAFLFHPDHGFQRK